MKMKVQKGRVSDTVLHKLKKSGKWLSIADFYDLGLDASAISASLGRLANHPDSPLEKAKCKEVGATSGPGIQWAYRYKQPTDNAQETAHESKDADSETTTITETSSDTSTSPATSISSSANLQTQLADFIADYLIQTLALSIDLMRDKLKFLPLPNNAPDLDSTKPSSNLVVDDSPKERLPRILVAGLMKRTIKQVSEPYTGIIDFRFWSPVEESDKLLSDKVQSAALDGAIIVTGSGIGHKHSDAIKKAAALRGFPVVVSMNGTSGIRDTIDTLYNAIHQERGNNG
jgi:hypothetical protein